MRLPTTEGSFNTGWFILFTADETKRIAKPVGDYGSPIAAAAALIPEPTVTNIISAGTAVLTFAAKRAVEKEKSLGLYIGGGNPLWPWRQIIRLMLMQSSTVSNSSRFLYFFYAKWAPFFYDEKQPQSLANWRRAAGISGQ
jgi:hypothetical protein